MFFSLQKTCEMDEESQLEGDFATQVTKIVSQIRLPLHSQKIREVRISCMSFAFEIIYVKFIYLLIYLNFCSRCINLSCFTMIRLFIFIVCHNLAEIIQEKITYLEIF